MLVSGFLPHRCGDGRWLNKSAGIFNQEFLSTVFRPDAPRHLAARMETVTLATDHHHHARQLSELKGSTFLQMTAREHSHRRTDHVRWCWPSSSAHASMVRLEPVAWLCRLAPDRPFSAPWRAAHVFRQGTPLDAATGILAQGWQLARQRAARVGWFPSRLCFGGEPPRPSRPQREFVTRSETRLLSSSRRRGRGQ